MDIAVDTIVHDSTHGRWTLLRKQPGPLLRPHVIDLEGYVETGGTTLVRREVPFAGIPLILVFDHHFSVCDKTGVEVDRLGRSFVAGLVDRPTFVGSPGRAFCMQVNLTPLGARRVLGIDMDELSGRIENADAILGREFRQLEEQLAHLSDWPQRFQLLEVWLADRLSRSPFRPPLVDEAYTRLARTGGTLGVDSLARGLDISRKHLGSLFRREIGMTPKSLARVLRFEHAKAALDGGKVRSLAALALDCGYADQPHFNREFREMSGLSPVALMRETLPDGTGIVAAR